MFKSATFKLTLYYICLVMAISLMFSFVLYQVGRGALITELTHQSARIYKHFPVFQHYPILKPQADIETGEQRLILNLAIFNIFVMVIAGFGSYALARRTLAPIEEAHEQQKRFTADVSHELRTPLTALKMESEVALMNPSPSVKELRLTLESNLEEANKLDALINNLLRLTRLEAGELRQHFLPVSSKKLVNQAISSVNSYAQNRQIKITKNIDEVMVLGDQSSLAQLLVTLLDNAIKYSPVGSKIEVEAHREHDQGKFIIIDHGKGIDVKSLDHIFDRFYRADDSRSKTETGGYGLGLSIAKMIADVHDGTIVITSSLKEGTTAEVFLPLAPKEETS